MWTGQVVGNKVPRPLGQATAHTISFWEALGPHAARLMHYISKGPLAGYTSTIKNSRDRGAQRPKPRHKRYPYWWGIRVGRDRARGGPNNPSRYHTLPIPSAAKYLMRRGWVHTRPKYFMRVEPCVRYPHKLPIFHIGFLGVAHLRLPK